MSRTLRHVPTLLVILAAIGLLPSAASAQQTDATGTVSGRVTSAAGRPVSGAIVLLETVSSASNTTTGSDGVFTFSNVAPGAYHVTIRSDGFLPSRTELTVSASTPRLEITLAADPHFSEVVSVSPDARSQFDSYQPASVLGGQELARELQPTIGATLGDQPGVATRSFGPGPARPVIRGFDGDRVLVLQDGQRMGDLSSQSGDHGVNVNPAAASKIEIVRGPATLLYGANAIGGLVNVITRSIPTAPVQGATGNLTFDLGSAASEAGGAGDVTVGRGHVAAHFSGSGSRSGDYSSPDGDVPNSFRRAGFGEGGVSFVTDNGYVGGSVGYDRTHYGIPFVEEGETNLDPRRTVVDLRAERRNLPGVFNSIRLSGNFIRYKHDELDGEEVATSFQNDTNELSALVGHREIGRLKGTIGVQGLTRSFSAAGEEALSPPVDQKGGAVFVYEEATVSPHVSVQFGGRVDHTAFTPEDDLTPRSFTNASGSIGLLVHTTEQTTLAFSLARASRNPALEELYFHGPHAGNDAVENGDDTLQSEHALGFDTSFRWQAPRVSGEVAVFYDKVDNYVFRQLTGEIDEDEGLPITIFTQGDATLTGIESHIDLQLTPVLWLEGGLDYVHGQLTDLDVPLPRMPPLRGRFGVRVQRNAFQAGVDGIFTATQDRIFTVEGDEGPIGETPTDGYNLFKIYAAYSFGTGRTTSTLAVRLDNAGNALYRNHLNYLKDLAPEVGRDFRVVYTVGF
jgi:iron complex outermembrane receptor protein